MKSCVVYYTDVAGQKDRNPDAQTKLGGDNFEEVGLKPGNACRENRYFVKFPK
jgi:hypothetical protein